jgi:hypothetical protein
MRVQDRLGDYPTVKLSVEEVARYAREADARVVEAESLARRSTLRPEPPADAEIEVTVEFSEAGTDGIDDVRPGADEVPNTDSQSEVRFAPRGSEGPRLLSVPCVVAAEEDLSWFQLDETAHVVLAMIDGESTVEDIVSTLSLPRASTLAILRELGTHGVIEFR